MTTKLADDHASINAQLNRIQSERQKAIAGEMPVVQPMYGGLDPSQGSESDGWTTYHATDWDPA